MVGYRQFIVPHDILAEFTFKGLESYGKKVYLYELELRGALSEVDKYDGHVPPQLISNKCEENVPFFCKYFFFKTLLLQILLITLFNNYFVM